MPDRATDLARRLADQAEAVCRHYLPAGRRQGRYWLVGDVANAPGRSLHVRLHGAESGRGARGRWADEATGEHGDLLDLIARREGLATLRDTLEEARRFLASPTPAPAHQARPPVPTGSPEAARRLFAMAQPIRGTLAEAYLRNRGCTDLRDCTALRFHPRCWYRGDEADPADRARDAWPALIAAVTDRDGTITGVHRTWLDPAGGGKAPVTTPRRALGHLLGNAVRFGRVQDVLAAGEGIETMLSLKRILPTLPMVAALSSAHLGALQLGGELRRLYLVRDDDLAGRRAVEALGTRATAAGIEAVTLHPALGDFNEDLQRLPTSEMTARLRVQLVAEDVARIMAR